MITILKLHHETLRHSFEIEFEIELQFGHGTLAKLGIQSITDLFPFLISSPSNLTSFSGFKFTFHCRLVEA